MLSTTTLINNDIGKYLNNNGKKLYRQNKNYRNIINILEHPEMRKFIDKFFSNVHDIKTILLFIVLYRTIENKFPIKLNGYQKLWIMHNMIRTPKIRQVLCNTISNINI